MIISDNSNDLPFHLFDHGISILKDLQHCFMIVVCDLTGKHACYKMLTLKGTNRETFQIECMVIMNDADALQLFVYLPSIQGNGNIVSFDSF